MLAFVARRVTLGFVVLFGLSLASFCFFARYGQYLQGHPVLLEYWSWLKGIFTGSSLTPLRQHSPTRINLSGGPTMEAAIGHTAVLLGLAFVFVLVFALGLALLAASRRGSIVDVAFRSLSYLAWGVPAFLLALLVQKFMNGVGGVRGIGPFPLAGWAGGCPAAGHRLWHPHELSSGRNGSDVRRECSALCDGAGGCACVGVRRAPWPLSAFGAARNA